MGEGRGVDECFTERVSGILAGKHRLKKHKDCHQVILENIYSV